jgi:hypothetical protein
MTGGCVVLDMRLRIEHQRPIERVKTLVSASGRLLGAGRSTALCQGGW